METSSLEKKKLSILVVQAYPPSPPLTLNSWTIIKKILFYSLPIDSMEVTKHIFASHNLMMSCDNLFKISLQLASSRKKKLCMYINLTLTCLLRGGGGLNLPVSAITFFS